MSSTLLLLALTMPWVPAHHDETTARERAQRFLTSRSSPVVLPLPEEQDAFFFVVYGDRTGGPPEGVQVLARAVAETNLLEPDLVMTVGDLVQGYNEAPQWLEQMREFKGIMSALKCPWFPVAGNHDVYWRGKGAKPPGEHETSYEQHFGPLWYAFEHKRSWFIALYSDEGDPVSGLKDFDTPSAQRMSAAQFDWLAATLERAKQAEHVFLFLHHPRWLGGGYGDDWERVHALLAKAGNVSAVFAGHIHHMRYDGRRDGIEYFALATVGGVQEGWAPAAGYLHQFHIVTVRKQGIAVASLPVGTVQDARAITGRVADEVKLLAAGLTARFDGEPAFADDLSLRGTCTFAVHNPTSRPIELTLVPSSADARWSFAPDHEHRTVEPGQRATLELTLARGPALLDQAFRVPELVLDVDYLGEGLRVPIPTRRFAVPLDLTRVPPPSAPANERVLELDGQHAALQIESRRLALPDGPFTIEGWLNAREFKPRQGFINKTESSEFGLFVSDGRPEFDVHVSGKYAAAKVRGDALTTNAWHHVAGVFDGNEARLYVDGRLAARAPGAGPRTPNDLPLYIGADVDSHGNGTSFFSGQLDEVRISKVARYTSDSFTPARRFEPDADALVLLHMDGMLGPWLCDSSERRAHATMAGQPRLVDAR